MWTDRLLNPEAILNLFGVAPSLADVSLYEVSLGRDGPRLLLRFDVNELPFNPPARWQSHQYNRVQLRLDFFPVKDLNMTGWSVDNRVTIDFGQDDVGLVVTATGSTVDLKFFCQFIRVDGATPYRV